MLVDIRLVKEKIYIYIWTPIHGHATVSWPAKTLHHLCVDTESSFERTYQGWMDGERESGKSVLSARLDDVCVWEREEEGDLSCNLFGH